MCVVNKEKSEYEVIVCDMQHYPICTLQFKSISLIARFLDEFDFERGICDIYRKKDMLAIDGKWLLELWKGRDYAL